jgi:hypothetical protein
MNLRLDQKVLGQFFKLEVRIDFCPGITGKCFNLTLWAKGYIHSI